VVSEAVSPRPVVVIHGALRSRAGLWPIVRFLRQVGASTRRRSATRPGRETLEQHGERLERLPRGLAQGTGAVLGILTHSMGGLVARAYLARAGAAGAVAGGSAW
jgi:pimeloyl-ACP methyl ester carboxylesterase